MGDTRRVLMLFLAELAVTLDEGKPLAEAIIMGAARLTDLEPLRLRGKLADAEAEELSARIKTALDIIKASPALPAAEIPARRYDARGTVYDW